MAVQTTPPLAELVSLASIRQPRHEYCDLVWLKKAHPIPYYDTSWPATAASSFARASFPVGPMGNELTTSTLAGTL